MSGSDRALDASAEEQRVKDAASIIKRNWLNHHAGLTARQKRRKVLAKKYVHATLVTLTPPQRVERTPILVLSRKPAPEGSDVGASTVYIYEYYTLDDFLTKVNIQPSFARENVESETTAMLHQVKSSNKEQTIEWPAPEPETSFTTLRAANTGNNRRNATFRAILGTTSTPIPRYAIVRPLKMSPLSPAYDYTRSPNMSETSYGEIITQWMKGRRTEPDIRRVDPLMQMQLNRIIPEFGQLQAQRFMELLELNGPKIDALDVAPHLKNLKEDSKEYIQIKTQLDELESFISEDDDRLDQVKQETINFAVRGKAYYESAQHAYFPKARLKLQKFWRDHAEMYQYWALHIPCHALVQPWKYATHECNGRHLEHFANGYKLSFPHTDDAKRRFGKRIETVQKVTGFILKYVTALSPVPAAKVGADAIAATVKSTISADVQKLLSFDGRGEGDSWSQMLEKQLEFWDNDTEQEDFNAFAKEHNGEGHLPYLWYKLQKTKPLPKGPVYNTFKELLQQKRFKDIWDNDANTRPEWKAHLFAMLDARTGERLYVCKNHKQPSSWDPDSHFVSGSPIDSAYDVQNVERRNQYYEDNDSFRQDQKARASIASHKLNIVAGTPAKPMVFNTVNKLAMQTNRVRDRVEKKRKKLYTKRGVGPIAEEEWSGRITAKKVYQKPEFTTYGPMTCFVLSPEILNSDAVIMTRFEAEATVSNGFGYPALSTKWMSWPNGRCIERNVGDTSKDLFSYGKKWLKQLSLPRAAKGVTKKGFFVWKPDFLLTTQLTENHDFDGGVCFTRRESKSRVRYICLDGSIGQICELETIKVIGRARGKPNNAKDEIQMLQVQDRKHLWLWLEASDWVQQDMIPKKEIKVQRATLVDETAIKTAKITLSRLGTKHVLMSPAETTDKKTLEVGTIIHLMSGATIDYYTVPLRIEELNTTFPVLAESIDTMGADTVDTMNLETEIDLMTSGVEAAKQKAKKKAKEKEDSDAESDVLDTTDATFQLSDASAYSIGAHVVPFSNNRQLGEIVSAESDQFRALEIIHQEIIPVLDAKGKETWEVSLTQNERGATTWIAALTTAQHPKAFVEPVELNYEYVDKNAARFMSGSDMLVLAVNGRDVRDPKEWDQSPLAKLPGVPDQLTVIAGVDQATPGDLEAIRTIQSIRKRAHLNRWPPTIFRNAKDAKYNLGAINTKIDQPLARTTFKDYALRSHLSRTQQYGSSDYAINPNDGSFSSSIPPAPEWMAPRIECFMKPGQGRRSEKGHTRVNTMQLGGEYVTFDLPKMAGLSLISNAQFDTRKADMREGCGEPDILVYRGAGQTLRVFGFTRVRQGGLHSPHIAEYLSQYRDGVPREKIEASLHDKYAEETTRLKTLNKETKEVAEFVSAHAVAIADDGSSLDVSKVMEWLQKDKTNVLMHFVPLEEKIEVEDLTDSEKIEYFNFKHAINASRNEPVGFWGVFGGYSNRAKGNFGYSIPQKQTEILLDKWYQQKLAARTLTKTNKFKSNAYTEAAETSSTYMNLLRDVYGMNSKNVKFMKNAFGMKLEKQYSQTADEVVMNTVNIDVQMSGETFTLSANEKEQYDLFTRELSKLHTQGQHFAGNQPDLQFLWMEQKLKRRALLASPNSSVAKFHLKQAEEITDGYFKNMRKQAKSFVPPTLLADVKDRYLNQTWLDSLKLLIKRGSLIEPEYLQLIRDLDIIHEIEKMFKKTQVHKPKKLAHRLITGMGKLGVK
jgi:hypothetical protein